MVGHQKSPGHLCRLSQLFPLRVWRTCQTLPLRCGLAQSGLLQKMLPQMPFSQGMSRSGLGSRSNQVLSRRSGVRICGKSSSLCESPGKTPATKCDSAEPMSTRWNECKMEYSVLCSCNKKQITEAQNCKSCWKSCTRRISFNVPQKANQRCNDSKTETTGHLKNKPRQWMQRSPLKSCPSSVDQGSSTKSRNHTLTKKICPYLKGLPPSHHLIGKQPQHQHRWCDVWKMWNGFTGTIESHIRNLKIPVETGTLTFASPGLVGCFTV